MKTTHRSTCRRLTLALAATLAACGPNTPGGDSGADTPAPMPDTARPDTNPPDSPPPVDTIEPPVDVIVDDNPAPVDAVEPDATPIDTGSPDAPPPVDAMDPTDVAAPDAVTDDAPAPGDSGPGDTGPGDTSPGDMGPGACPTMGETRCGETCANLQTDSSNCGACGNLCPRGQSCSMGVCGCATGNLTCGGMCVNPMTDTANCGMCGRACGAGQTCAAGACACPMGETSCGTGSTAACVDTTSDNANCGMCGRACPMGQSCNAGMCVCPTGQTSCGSGAGAMCVNTQSDSANCGACGTACPMGRTCSMGACVCPTGQTSCGTGATATCVNAQTDNMNCGACGTTCTGGATCTAGSCTCAMGETRCGTGGAAQCVNTGTDRANCGACGTACAAGQVCNGGMCETTCSAPRMRCGTGAAQVCTDTTNDDQNCGTCGTVCGTVPNSFAGLCTTGTCRPICTSGFGNCNNTYADGCEVNLTNNLSNCGACGAACPTTAANASSVSCQASRCTPACVPDTATDRFRDCNTSVTDGCETNIQTSNNNCGACGTVCGTGETCQNGSCVPPSCRSIHTLRPTAPSGMFTIDPDGNGGNAPFSVFCDMTTAGGGWTIIFSPPSNANNNGRLVDYDVTDMRLRTDATEVLLAYRPGGNLTALTAGFSTATFPMPTNWRTQSPFKYQAVDEMVNVSVDGAAAVSRQLRYGFSNWPTLCTDPWSPSSDWGRLCIANTGATPYYNSFAHPTADQCPRGDATWNSFTCDSTRTFTIAVR